MPESYKEDGRPAQQWYWDDWFSAFDVRLCSLAARGLWIDMLGIMFKAEIRGTLTVNGKKIHSKTIAKITGASIVNVERLLKELERHDVFSKLEDDTIICRRMFRKSGRKDQISKIRSESGKKGAEKRWQKMPNMATTTSSPTPTPTSSSKDNGFAIEKEFIQFWNYYNYKVAKKDAIKAFTALRRKDVAFNEIMEAAKGYFNHLKNEKMHSNFEKAMMYPATFLRNEKWKDFLGITYKPPM